MAQGKLSIQPESPSLEIHRIVFDEKTISSRIHEIGEEISKDYAGKDLIVVGILKGATLFTCDLVRAISIPLTLDFISINHYTAQPGSGSVRILKDLEEDISGRHVLLIEDLVDTGFTLNYLVRVIESRQPASVGICSLLDRPDLRLVEIPIKYSGFHVNQEFLIGYGLDYRECYRELPYIASVKLSDNRS